MAKPGPKPKGKVKISWSSDLAYAIGLLAADGCVSSDGRHIIFTSKDKEQIENYYKALNITAKIGKKSSGSNREKKYFVAQFSDVLFHAYLQSIGLGINKSRTISKVFVPEEYFFDFLRGLFDGDGSTYSYYDKRWKNSFMFYTSFTSGSKDFAFWLLKEIRKRIAVSGSISEDCPGKNPYYQIKFAKADSELLFGKMYYKKDLIYLKRKHLKIRQSLDIVHQS